MEELRKFLNGWVVVKVGDITQEDADAIVNAANGALMGGGGVDGAIHRAGGPAILEQCKEIRRTMHPDGLPTGHAVATTAGKMKTRYVIHTVGPVYSPGKDKKKLLADCYRNSLALAAKHGLATIAFPSIATGLYGYPREEAAQVSSRAIEDFLGNDSIVRQVRLIFFSGADADVFVQSHAFSA